MKKFSKIILAMIMALQFALPQAVLADAVKPEKILVDFSTQDQLGEPRPGPSTLSYVTGQYGKTANDTSLRMSTDGADTTVTTDGAWIYKDWSENGFNGQYGDATQKPYQHFSVEYLPEDENSGIVVTLGATNAWKTFDLMNNRSATNTMTITGGKTVAIDIGAWNKLDFYFDETSTFTVFKNGVYVTSGTLPADIEKVNTFYNMRFYQYVKKDSENKSIPSALQFDNILFERIAKIPNPMVMFDFETSGQVTEFLNDVGVITYEKGQAFKAADDTSIRLATEGVAATKENVRIFNEFSSMPGDSARQYLHFSMEFMQEDAKSGIQVDLGKRGSNDWAFINNVITTDKTTPRQVKFIGVTDKFYQNFGSWNKVDMYFDKEAAEYTLFFNGTKATGTLPEGSFPITYFYKMQVWQLFNKVGDVSIPSAVQFDNIYFERVEAIPEAQEYSANGEILDFEDLYTIGTWNAVYAIEGNSGSVAKFPTVGNPAVKFGQNQNEPQNLNPDGTTALTVIGGYKEQPTWNKVLHSNFPQSDSAFGSTFQGQGIHYNTSVTDLKPGDIGHLTFKTARIADDGSCNVILYAKAGTMKYSDGSTNTDRVEVLNTGWNGAISAFDNRFYGQSTGVKLLKETWAKFDIIYKVGETDTKIDCYMNGEKIIGDYVLSDTAYLEYIGDLYFASGKDMDYVLDDLGFARFTKDTMIDPTVGCTITSSDAALASRINNAGKIAVVKDYTVEAFKQNVNEVVKAYTQDGTEITSGSMADASIIEVSNGFGGKTYFSISDYVLEETFDGSLNTLITQFGGSEDNIVPENERVIEYVYGEGGKDADEQSILFGSIETSTKKGDMFVRNSVGPFAGETVTFEISARPLRGETEIQLTPNNGLKYSTDGQDIVKFMPNNEIRIMGNDIILDEKWIADQWYKVAAVMTKDNIKVYLNGEEVYNGKYMNSVESFNSLAHISLTVLVGQCGFDDLRVSFNEYEPTVDLITSKDDDNVFVNNADSIIGFTDEIPAGITADILKALVTNDKLTYDGSKVFVRKGETIKYYTLGYKTKEFKRPVIEVSGKDVFATSELVDTAKAAVNTQSVAILLAIYDTATNRLVSVVTDSAANSHNAEADLVATIENGVASDKYAIAYMWDGMGSLKPLKSPKSLDFAKLVSE